MLLSEGEISASCVQRWHQIASFLDDQTGAVESGLSIAVDSHTHALIMTLLSPSVTKRKELWFTPDVLHGGNL